MKIGLFKHAQASDQFVVPKFTTGFSFPTSRASAIFICLIEEYLSILHRFYRVFCNLQTEVAGSSY